MTLITTETIEINRKKIAFLYLNNPETKNSMTWAMSIAFRQEIQKLKDSSEPPSSLILTGKNNIFSSGGDLSLLRSFKEKTYEENKRDMYEFYNNFLCIRTLPFPVVAAVNGHAVGAALSLAFACDLRVFSSTSKYAFNFVKLGIHPGMGSSYLIKELFGVDMANHLLLLGDFITGEEAKSLRLCQDAVPPEDVVKRATELAIVLSEGAPMASRLLKETLINKNELETALRREAEAQALCFQSKDFAESLDAIVEKRKPFFTGK
jgi:2-(1,2-epoxy-1,2-dihydrophenyl)acetyl-CoA isomerase